MVEIKSEDSKSPKMYLDEDTGEVIPDLSDSVAEPVSIVQGYNFSFDQWLPIDWSHDLNAFEYWAPFLAQKNLVNDQDQCCHL